MYVTCKIRYLFTPTCALPWYSLMHCIVCNVYDSAGASRYQFDTSIFLNGDDWEKLGRRQLRQQQLQQADSLSSDRAQLSPSIGHKPNSSVTKTDFDVVDVSPRDRQRAPVTKATVNALFELDKGSNNGSTVDHFVSSVSEPDSGSHDDKAENRLPVLTTLMQMLSVQQSSSYRSSRVSPPPRQGAMSRRRRSQLKKRVSSFALTMNNAERQTVKYAVKRPGDGEQSVRWTPWSTVERIKHFRHTNFRRGYCYIYHLPVADCYLS